MDQNSFVDDLFYSCLKCKMHIEVGIVQSNQIKMKKNQQILFIYGFKEKFNVLNNA